LTHRVGGLDEADQPARLDHPERVTDQAAKACATIR
jgi:hypothetical protein